MNKQKEHQSTERDLNAEDPLTHTRLYNENVH
jgi:hypothetical protein